MWAGNRRGGRWGKWGGKREGTKEKPKMSFNDPVVNKMESEI